MLNHELASPEIFSAPGELTFRGQVDRIPTVMNQATKDLTEELLCSMPETELAATYAFSAVRLLRPILSDPRLYDEQSDLLRITGGDPQNPHYTIDTLAGTLARHLAIRMSANEPAKIGLCIEEDGHWSTVVGVGKDPASYLVVIDPIDNSHRIKDKTYTQSTAIAVMDETGNFRAGAVASLSDSRVVLVEEGQIRRYLYDYGTGIIYDVNQRRGEGWKQNSQPLTLAILPSRIAEYQNILEKLSKDLSGVTLIQNFGGHPLLDLLFPLGREIDALLDLYKGQKLYEPWGVLAQAAGAIVRGLDNKPIDFATYYREAYQNNDIFNRISYGIYRSTEVFDFLSSKL